ncbi:hypothetical protein ACIA98_35455 [Streptomyces sp. NPDC051366]|uniref:hypothetical protein n=1 Tax=Streptomyces sp. NPDC051366 TaxID=3365652 RepID=UPI0037932269
MVGLPPAGVAPSARAETVRPQQWHLVAVKADDTRTTSTGKGVMDTGLGRIPELEGQVVLGRDVSDGYEDDERADSDDHDTGIAALSAGTGK